MRKTVNTLLSEEEKSILTSMVGKRFDGYRCDEFHFRPAVYQLVGISVDVNAFAIKNIIKPTDFFGSIEDVGCISITPIPCLPVQS